jgi:hypothetical protein
MRRVLRDNGLSITVFALFLVSFVLHALPSSVGGQLAVRGRSPWSSLAQECQAAGARTSAAGISALLWAPPVPGRA